MVKLLHKGMISELLTREECAACRICCCFDSYDLWEAPTISSGLKEKILPYVPATDFLPKGGSYVLKMKKEKDRDLYYCNLLDRSRGCVLGEDKPFECSIWPLRVMDFCGKRVIALSPVCPVLQSRPIGRITETAKRLAPVIFEQASKNPDLVKKYEIGYTILVTED